MSAPQSWHDKSNNGCDHTTHAPDKPCDTVQDRPGHELADIFRQYGEEYRRTHKLTAEQKKAMHDIEFCRTHVFGHHVDECDVCGHLEKGFNSCRNRNCPKCQSGVQMQWVEDRLDQLLPVPYYHIVFTLPNLIFLIAIYNQKLVYDLLFASVAATLKVFGLDPTWLGADIGFTAVLHTWGQTLVHHPHIHIIIPAGGLNAEGKWVAAPYGERFLFPKNALADVFQGKFVAGLKKLYYGGELELPGDLGERFADVDAFEGWINTLVADRWIVFIQSPMIGPEAVVRYLGRYTHRTAISNRRILSIDNGQISFSYKDYADRQTGSGQPKQKVMTLSADEFITRFLYHIPPKGYHRIRHYGFLANGQAEKKLANIREQVGAPLPTQLSEGSETVTGAEAHRAICPHCGQGRMIPILIVHPWGTIVPANSQAGVNSS